MANRISRHRHNNQGMAERDLVVMILPGRIIKAPNTRVYCVFGNVWSNQQLQLDQKFSTEEANTILKGKGMTMKLLAGHIHESLIDIEVNVVFKVIINICSKAERSWNNHLDIETASGIPKSCKSYQARGFLP